MIIYCLTIWGDNMTNPSSSYYASLQGVCNKIKSIKPIDNKMIVFDRDTAGQYDINPDNLKYLLEQSQKLDFGAMFRIKSNFFLTQIEITYTLSIIKVKD